MKLFKLTGILLLALMSFLISSCETDSKVTKEEVDPEILAAATEFLNGDIVLSIHTLINNVNKTLLPTGCPAKFNFAWSESEKNTFSISLFDFTVGKMGMKINFRCDVKTMNLNSWEKNEYQGPGWFKFYGVDGNIWFNTKADNSMVKGSSVTGFFNVDTHEIKFDIDFNMMNVRSECFRQNVDKSRIEHFDEELAQYEKDLAEYKKQHGLD